MTDINYVYVGFCRDSGEPKQVHPVKPHGDIGGDLDWQLYFPASFAREQFAAWGTDACRSCEGGRVTLFSNKAGLCFSCERLKKERGL